MLADPPLFHRHDGNPIITADHLPYRANTVFNPGAVRVGDETVLLVRVEDMRGISHLTVARSQDGLTGWQIDSSPTFSPDPDRHPEELWGIEDPRITWLPEQNEWAVVFTATGRVGDCAESPSGSATAAMVAIPRRAMRMKSWSL